MLLMAKDLNLVDFDLQIKTGDFVKNQDSRQQHYLLLLIAGEGNFRETPWAGVDIKSYINDNISKAELAGDIKEKMKLDGVTRPKVRLNEVNQMIESVQMEGEYD